MHFWRGAVAQLGYGNDRIAGQHVKRAETFSTSSSASSALPASTASSGAALSTGLDVSSSTSGAAPSVVASSTTSSLDDSGGNIVTVFISKPEFTATKTTAYTAHGINATETKTGTSVYSADTYLATANATAPGIPDNELTACQINGTSPDNGPFCTPIHRQNLWAGYTYAFTWNPALAAANMSDFVILRYDDGTQDVVWNSSLIEPLHGYVNINMQEAWLNGKPGNDSSSGQNMTLYLQSDPLHSPGNITKGPSISLVVNPKTLPRVLIPKLPARLGLEIGLPIGVVAAFIIIIALWCGSKRHNKSWGDLRGHGKDYMARRARRRGVPGKEGAIQLEDYGSPRGQDSFSDEPYSGGTGNAFRDEIAKQREEDDRYRPTVHSY